MWWENFWLRLERGCRVEELGRECTPPWAFARLELRAMIPSTASSSSFESNQFNASPISELDDQDNSFSSPSPSSRSSFAGGKHYLIDFFVYCNHRLLTPCLEDISHDILCCTMFVKIISWFYNHYFIVLNNN